MGEPADVTYLLARTLGQLGADSSNDAVSRALRELGAAAAELDPIDRALVRRGAVNGLDQVGVKGGATLVDAAIAQYAPNGNGGGDPGQGRALVLSRPAPWPDPVDGAALLEELAQTFSRFAALPAGGATALALWTVHAHSLAAAFTSPLLALTSAEKRSGKTTTLTVLSALVPAPLPASSISPAALFRTIERDHPTLLLDEADTVFSTNEDLRTLLNAGHTRATAIAIRTVGDQHEPRAFSTWGAKAVALIGTLPGTLSDRSVTLRLVRRLSSERVDRLREDRLGQLEPLRRRAVRWAADALTALKAADPDVPPELHDRAADNWRPLLAIADAAGGTWPERARHAARVLSGVEEGAGSSRELLLGDLRDLFAQRGVGRLASTDIVEALVAREDRPWPEWRAGRPLTVRGLARLLEPFGVRPKVCRLDRDRLGRGYQLEDLAPVFGRYLPETPLSIRDTRNNPSAAGLFSDSGPVTDSSERYGSESGETPSGTGTVTGVTVPDPPRGQEDPEDEARRALRDGA
jgi:putative DNA primase/helicase